MLNRSPWLWGVRKTAAGLTGRTSRGQQILQGKRAKGQSNPSPQYIQSQSVTHQLTPIFQKIASVIRAGFTQLQTGWTRFNAFYNYNYTAAFDLTSPPTATINLANLLISKGIMTPTPLSAATTASAAIQTVDFHTLTTAADDTQNVLDIAWCAIFNITQSKWAGGTVSGRGTSAKNFVCPPDTFIAGDSLICYLGFVADPTMPNAGTSSNSVNSTITAGA